MSRPTGLRIADTLSLPRDTVTSTLIVYGGKGKGKTNLLSVVLEEMSAARLKWSSLDPIGVHWGLRYAADGGPGGIKALALGGVHGEIPIYPDSGHVVAELVANEDVNTIVDFSRDKSGRMWTNGERIRFARDYASSLFQLQGSLVNGRRREPVFVGLDEAARYIPQLIPGGKDNAHIAECVGAWEQLVEEGRNVGVGVGLFTQRSARINKSVAELADAMIAFNTTGPNSIGAIVDWLGEHIEKTRQREIVEQVRKLPVGTALVVSPAWLNVEAVVPMRARQTFDSSSTPKPGERGKRVRGKAATVVDLGKYRERMAETIEKAKAEDPAELRKANAAQARVIADLKRKLDAAARAKPEPKPSPPVEVPVLPRDTVRRLEAAVAKGLPIAETVGALLHDVRNALARLESSPRATTKTPSPSGPPAPRDAAVQRREAVPRPHVRAQERSPDGDGPITEAQQRILDAVAWLHAVGFERPTKLQTGFIAGYRVGKKVGGTYGIELGKLRAADLLAYPTPGTVVLTPTGRAYAEPVDIEPSTNGLQGAIFDKLDDAERRILRALIGCYPEPMSKQELGEAAGYTVGPKVGGTYGIMLGRLRTLGLIEYPTPGQARAAAVLFLEEDREIA